MIRPHEDTGLVQGLKRAQAKRGRADSSSRQRQADHAGLLIRPQDRMAGSIFPRFCFEDDVSPWIMRTAPLIDERDFFAKDVAEAYDFAERFDRFALGSVSPRMRRHGEPPADELNAVRRRPQP